MSIAATESPTTLNAARIMMLQILRTARHEPISAILSKLEMINDYLDDQVAPAVLKNEKTHYCLTAGTHVPLPDDGCKNCGTRRVEVAAAPPCYLCGAIANQLENAVNEIKRLRTGATHG